MTSEIKVEHPRGPFLAGHRVSVKGALPGVVPPPDGWLEVIPYATDIPGTFAYREVHETTMNGVKETEL